MSGQKVVVCSGYFDPLHYGHVEYLERSKALGDTLVVIVNNDAQAAQKKGRAFMPCAERVKVVRALRCVDAVIESVDQDRSVCQTLAMLHPSVFANGGDRAQGNVPETAVCERMGIQMVDGLGDKIQSSSHLIAAARAAALPSTPAPPAPKQ